MDYIIGIPTMRERSQEVYRCISSILKQTREYPIVIFGQTNDSTTQNIWRETLRFNDIIYLNPNNLNRLIIYLTKNLNESKDDLRALFNFRTYGGARNVLTAFMFLFSRDPAVINVDDDEEVIDGFFYEHERLLGSRKNNKTINLVTGPYENHGSYVGIETLIDILKHRRSEQYIKNALNAITPEVIHPNYVYGIQGSIGGNLSRYGSALLIPYASSPEDIPLRGEDEIQAYLNQIINHNFINAYTPEARVKHTKKPGYIFESIKGETIGVIVHDAIRYIISNRIDFNETGRIKELIQYKTDDILSEFLEKVIKSSRHRKRYVNLDKDIETVLNKTTLLLRQKNFFEKQSYNHLQTLLYGLKKWREIINCLSDASENQKKYILSL